MIEVLFAVCVVGLILLVLMIFVKPASAVNRKYFTQHWRQIQTAMNGSDNEQRMSLVVADKLLDEALKQLRVPGGNMGDRLRAAKGRFRYVDKVWSAHKLRNRIVHEPGDRSNYKEIKQAVHDFERALKDLGAL